MSPSMRVLAAAALLPFMVSGALADATCKAQATDKKLAGAAKSAFTKKCVADAVGG